MVAQHSGSSAHVEPFARMLRREHHGLDGSVARFGDLLGARLMEDGA
jgi:hypothetical protein